MTEYKCIVCKMPILLTKDEYMLRDSRIDTKLIGRCVHGGCVMSTIWLPVEALDEIELLQSERQTWMDKADELQQRTIAQHQENERLRAENEEVKSLVVFALYGLGKITYEQWHTGAWVHEEIWTKYKKIADEAFNQYGDKYKKTQARVQELEQELKNKCANCGLIISHGIWGDEDSEYDALSPTEGA